MEVHGILSTKDYKHFSILSIQDSTTTVITFDGADKAKGCLPGDQVSWNAEKECIELISVANHGPIVGILELTSKTRYGLTTRGHPIFLFRPFDPSYPPFIVGSSQKNLTQNMLCSILYRDAWKSDSTFPRGEIVDYFGHVGDWRAERAAILVRWCPGKPAAVPKQDWENRQATPEQLHERYEISETSGFTFHIDPEGCRDVDDILTICNYDQADQETFTAIITIADVAAWILPDSSIAQSAFQIGQTFYSEKGEVLRPMLRDILSENALTLKNNQIVQPLQASSSDSYKLGISLVLKIGKDAHGNPVVKSDENAIKLSKVKTSCIHTFTYDNFIKKVSDLKGIDLIARTLLLYWALERSMGRAGSEYTGLARGSGDDKDTSQGTHYLIESCMLYYNNFVGRFLEAEGLANQTLYRNQDAPSAERIQKWIQIGTAQGLGESLAWLGSRAARYTLGDGQHASLGLATYTHSSSPIRRFADLWNQWLIHNVFLKKSGKEQINISAITIQNLVEYTNSRARAGKRFSRELAILSALERGEREIEGICLEWQEKPGGTWKGRFWIPAWKEIAIIRQLPDRPRPDPGNRCRIHCGVNWVCSTWRERFVLEII